MSMDLLKSLYFEFLSYFIPQKISYRIEGKCNKCGECCRQIRCYGLKNEKELKIMQFFFLGYRNLYIKDKDENGELILSCKHLNTNGSCNIYNKRPFFCRTYPKKKIYSNLEMIDGCGYKIIKKEFKDYL